jgi:hypothetical protein
MRLASRTEARFPLVRDGLLSTDVAIAAEAFNAACDMEVGTRRSNLLGTACVSRFAKVRAAALRELLKLHEPSTSSLVRVMCLDSSPLVRSVALAAAGTDLTEVLGQAASMFDDLTRSARERAVALQVICSQNAPGATQACVEATRSPAAVLRRAGYSALMARSAGEAARVLVEQALSDESAKVRQLAVEHVRGGVEPPPLATLEALAMRADLLGNVLSVLAHTPPWDRMSLLMQLLSVKPPLPDESMARAQRALEDWCRDMTRTFVHPSTQHRERIVAQWPNWRAALEGRLASQVEFHLSTFGLLPSA